MVGAGVHHDAGQRRDAVAAQQGQVIGHAVQRVGVVAGDEQAAAFLGKFIDLFKLGVAEILLRRGNEQQGHVREGTFGGQIDGYMVIAVALQKRQQQLQRIRGKLSVPLQNAHRRRVRLRYGSDGLRQRFFIGQALRLEGAGFDVVPLGQKVGIVQNLVAARGVAADDDAVGLGGLVRVAGKARENAGILRDISLLDGHAVAEHGVAVEQLEQLRILRAALVEQVEVHIVFQTVQHGARLLAGGGVRVEAQVRAPAIFILQCLNKDVHQHADRQEASHQQRSQLAVAPLGLAKAQKQRRKPLFHAAPPSEKRRASRTRAAHTRHAAIKVRKNSAAA